MFENQLTINIKGNLLDFSTPKIMGILNVTPDSFFDGGKHAGVDAALEQTEVLLNEGADIIDIGAYSSRPGATHVSAEEELRRLIPVIKAIHKGFPEAILSIDTFRADVARASIAAGAHLINDISGGSLDDKMFETIAALEVPYVLMHMRGTPRDMQELTEYEDIVSDIIQFFCKRVSRLRELGVKDIILDPGFGFAKTLEQNYELLHRIDELHVLGLPILGALSRKSMIYKKLGVTPAEALNGTTALHAALLLKGVQIFRVHDVKAVGEVIQLLAK